MQVLLLDDHAMVRDGITTLLAAHHPDWTVRQAANADEAVALLQSDEGFDLAMVDLGLSGPSDPDIIAKLRDCRETLPLLIVSANDDLRTIRRCFKLGADGFVSKAAAAGQLVEAVNQLIAGEQVIPALAQVVEANDPFELLSPRQLDVVRLMAGGQSNREIGESLGIAEATVKVHVHKVLRLLNVSSRAKATVLARDSGLTS